MCIVLNICVLVCVHKYWHIYIGVDIRLGCEYLNLGVNILLWIFVYWKGFCIKVGVFIFGDGVFLWVW